MRSRPLRRLLDMDATTTELDPRFSSEGAEATAWPAAEDVLRHAETFWVVTVRPRGRAHATPLLAVLVDGALHFTTGPDERKARNLSKNPSCSLLTGRDDLDVAVEGDARRITDPARLARVAEAYLEKYGEEWRYVVRDGGVAHAPASIREDDAGLAHVFEVVPVRAFGFGKGDVYSQTRWTFAAA